MSGPDDGSAGRINPARLTMDIYNLLCSLPRDEQQRVWDAVATLLDLRKSGFSAGPPSTALAMRPRDPPLHVPDDVLGSLRVGPRAQKWLQRYGITREMLDEVFHLADGFTISASHIPGSTKKEMTANCYLLCGIRGLLRNDTPAFQDVEAIMVCKRLAAYDKNNHTVNRASLGNRMTGTRPTLMLTGPGETAAAELIKSMSRG